MTKAIRGDVDEAAAFKRMVDEHRLVVRLPGQTGLRRSPRQSTKPLTK